MPLTSEKAKILLGLLMNGSFPFKLAILRKLHPSGMRPLIFGGLVVTLFTRRAFKRYFISRHTTFFLRSSG